MFSGIITHLGRVVAVETTESGVRLTTASAMFAAGADPLRLGESIAHSGVCLTVVAFGGGEASFDIGSETLRCTTLGGLRPGDPLNLERSLRVGDRIDGHFVQGHVEQVGTILSVEEEGSTTKFVIGAPSEFFVHVAPKGSVAVDGVSLTVGEVGASTFSVYVIPATRSATMCAGYTAGSKVNLESDCIARYVAAALLRGNKTA